MGNKLSYYEEKLRNMVIWRRQVSSIEPWLEGVLHAAAMNWQMMEKVHDEIINGDLTTLETGSMGQVKTIVNPLFPMYKELQRTMLLHYKALGLSFDAAPDRMTKAATVGGQETNDPLAELYGSSRDLLNK